MIDLTSAGALAGAGARPVDRTLARAPGPSVNPGGERPDVVRTRGNPFSFRAYGVSCRARAERDRATQRALRFAPGPSWASGSPAPSRAARSGFGWFRRGRLADCPARCRVRRLGRLYRKCPQIGEYGAQ